MSPEGIFLLIIFILAGMYLAIMVLIISGLFRLKKPVPRTEPVHTKVSIIIPARNEENRISDCLRDIVIQEFPEAFTEVLVVDDYSSDRTAEIVREFASDHPSFPLELIQLKEPGMLKSSKKAAIEAAVSRASGELIITTDADTFRGKDWLRAVVNYYEQNHPRMILCPVAFREEDDLFTRLQSLEFMGLISATAGACRSGFPIMCNGANLAYEKRAFGETGGYADNKGIASGDDIFLMMKIRKKYGSGSVHFLLSEDSVVYTHACRTFREFFYQRLRWVSKNRNYSDFLISGVALVTWLFSFILLAGIIGGIFSHPVLFVSLLMVAGKMLVEFLPVRFMAGFLRKKDMLLLYPLTGILNVFYTVLIGIAGMIIPFEWKGRKVT